MPYIDDKEWKTSRRVTLVLQVVTTGLLVFQLVLWVLVLHREREEMPSLEQRVKALESEAANMRGTR